MGATRYVVKPQWQEHHAAELYEVYRDAWLRGNQGYGGEPPLWSELTEQERDAWLAVAIHPVESQRIAFIP